MKSKRPQSLSPERSALRHEPTLAARDATTPAWAPPPPEGELSDLHTAAAVTPLRPLPRDLTDRYLHRISITSGERAKTSRRSTIRREKIDANNALVPRDSGEVSQVRVRKGEDNKAAVQTYASATTLRIPPLATARSRWSPAVQVAIALLCAVLTGVLLGIISNHL